MPKTPHTTKTSLRDRGSSAGPAAAGYPDRMAEKTKLVELRPGLFLNLDHIVTLRVLPQEEDNAHAILQLSNGDRLNITRAEFTAISGEEPRPSARLPQPPAPKSKVGQ